jgi:hypothetical protein
MKFPGGLKTPIPNNHQPYIGLRVWKPLPTVPPTVPPIVPPPPTISPVGRPTPVGKNLGSRLELTNQTMYEGDYLQSENGIYRFICQGDGNVLLYGPGNVVVWKSDTAGKGHPSFRIVAQADRNVVQYDINNTALWRTGTSISGSNQSVCILILQDDRNLVLYDPGDHWKALWNSKTAERYWNTVATSSDCSLPDYLEADRLPAVRMKWPVFEFSQCRKSTESM